MRSGLLKGLPESWHIWFNLHCPEHIRMKWPTLVTVVATVQLLCGATVLVVCVELREITASVEALLRNSQDFPVYFISVVNLVSRQYCLYLLHILYKNIYILVEIILKHSLLYLVIFFFQMWLHLSVEMASLDYNNFPQCLLHFPCFCLLLLFLVPWQMRLENGYFAGGRIVMTVTPGISAHSCKQCTWTISSIPVLQHAHSGDLWWLEDYIPLEPTILWWWWLWLLLFTFCTLNQCS